MLEAGPGFSALGIVKELFDLLTFSAIVLLEKGNVKKWVHCLLHLAVNLLI